MSFYKDHIYPHLVSVLGDPPPIREVRQRIVPPASGRVLEIGVGPGVNFTLYDSSRVSKVYALEPNPGMIRLAEPQRQRTKLDIEFLDLPGERIPLEDSAVDTVVSTFTFCTIPGVADAIRGLHRVLRPGGKLIFFSSLNTDYHPIHGYDAGRNGPNRFLTGYLKAVISLVTSRPS